VSTDPVTGTVLGTFDAEIPREFVAGLDEILGSTAPLTSHAPIPPGAFVFFTFLPDMSWMDKTGVSFERSLAVRRRLRVHQDIYAGDQLVGRSVISEVSHDRRGRARRFVTISTDYHRGSQLALEESVTYLTTLEAIGT
jgi:hypothetical protein